jgi:hypothetical protein
MYMSVLDLFGAVLTRAAIGGDAVQIGQSVTFAIRSLNRRLTLKRYVSTSRSTFHLSIPARLSACHADLCVSLFLVVCRNFFRKGMVLVGGEDHPRPVREFMASVLILHHSTTISTGTFYTYIHIHHEKPLLDCQAARRASRVLVLTELTWVDALVCAGYQPIIHAGVVRQAAEMRAIDASEALRTGARADVMFRFMYVTTHLPTHAHHLHSTAKRRPTVLLDDDVPLLLGAR